MPCVNEGFAVGERHTSWSRIQRLQTPERGRECRLTVLRISGNMPVLDLRDRTDQVVQIVQIGWYSDISHFDISHFRNSFLLPRSLGKRSLCCVK